MIDVTASTPNTAQSESTLDRGRRVIMVEIEALNRLLSTLGDEFSKAVELIEKTRGRVIVTGMGKSGLIGKKIAATLSSTGTPAYFLHPAEGSHGDLGMLVPEDLVLAISYSGETPEILQVLPIVKRFGLPLIAMTGNPNSTLAQRAEVSLDISVEEEACSLNLAPTASTTATLALGDALAITLLDRKGFTEDDFAVFHPAGALGKRLLYTVADLMHHGDTLPLIPLNLPFGEALIAITEKKLGIGLVTNDHGDLLGIITDGDIRRILTKTPDIRPLRAADVYTQNPKFIEPTALAVTALKLMEDHQITSLVVLQPESKKPEGVIHLHDILKTGIH